MLVSGKVRHASSLKPQDRRHRRLDRSDERQKGDCYCERTKGEGEMPTLFPSFLTLFVSNPHSLIRSLSLLLLAKIQQNLFFMTNHYFSFESFFLFPDQLCALCAQTLQIAP
jgi:hypothetical protein